MVFERLKRATASLAIRDDFSWAANIAGNCYNDCNEMAADRQILGIGKNCSSTRLLPDLRNCYNCAKGMKNETNFANFIQTMIDECVLGEPITASEIPTGTASQTSATQTSTTQTTNPAQSSNTPEGHTNLKTVVPAVVVPVLVVGLAVALLFVFMRRRRRRRSASCPTSSSYSEDKAQLHADDFRPELDGSDASRKKSEVVHEMSAGPAIPSRLDHKVELPAGEIAEEMEAKRENK